jgi:prepilin-type N-terminal cleavage/methylation domain-containing protein
MIKSEKGFTLVELLITIALLGLIFGVTAAVIYQLSTVSGAGENRLAAIHDLQNASYWFNQDGQMADCATQTNATNVTFIIHGSPSVEYSWAGADSKLLTRTDNTGSMTLAQHISSVTFKIQSQLVAMDLTSTVTNRTTESENFNYQVNMRAVAP